MQSSVEGEQRLQNSFVTTIRRGVCLTVVQTHQLYVLPLASTSPTCNGSGSSVATVLLLYAAQSAENVQLTRILEGSGSDAASVSPEIVKSVTRCVRETKSCIEQLKGSLDSQMEEFAGLVKYLKGLKPNTTVCLAPWHPSQLLMLCWVALNFNSTLFATQGERLATVFCLDALTTTCICA